LTRGHVGRTPGAGKRSARGTIMAKGQMRSNKEVKKPKKDKSKPAVVVANSSATRIAASQDKAKDKN
jgi:hypothetical protein